MRSRATSSPRGGSRSAWLIGPAVLAFAATLSCGDGSTEPSPPPPPPDPPRPTTVTVTPATASLLAMGDTVRLTAEVRDQNGRPMAGAPVVWSSGNAAVATVDASGLVTGVTAGEVEIAATSSGVAGRAALTVVDPAPTTVAVTPATVALTALGETEQLTADVRDQAGRPMAGASVSWSSADTSVATVDAAGLVTAAGNGEAMIAVTAGSVSGTAMVTVAQEVDAVSVSPPADALTALGDTVRLTGRATDANGHAVAGAEFSWASSDTSVASVDASGLVTAAGNGEAMIAATSGSASGAATVAVAQEADAVSVSPPADTLTALGDTVRLTGRATDANGHAVSGAEFSWASSDASVASVDASGLVTAVGGGRATITATAGSASGAGTVTVAQEVDAVSVSPLATTLTALGETVRLTGRATDANGHAVAGAEFSWASSDTSVARVDGSGLVTAAGNGEATVTATAGSATAAAVVTVAQEVDFVRVSPGSVSFSEIGESASLTAEAVDVNGHAVAGAEFSWESSDASVATVDAAGLVTAAGFGSATITARSGSASGTATVTVAREVDFVRVSPASVSFSEIGESATLTAEAVDANGHAVAGAAFSWESSDASVATVDASGLVTAAGFGSATITARSGSASGTATVTVAQEQEVAAVSVSPSSGTVAVGDSVRLSASATDANGHAVSGTAFSWSSSAAAVATVSSSGWVKGVAEGSATITAAAGSFSATASITVTGPSAAAPAAYLVQTVQSMDSPVTLAAGEQALLRVFPTASKANSAQMPRVKAYFYIGGTLVHTADIASKTGPIPTRVDEGSLNTSANATIPGSVIKPNLQMVVEIDPDSTHLALGTPARIPATGRLSVDVKTVRDFDITFVPFLYRSSPDSSIIATVNAMGASPGTHSLLWQTGDLLPVVGFDATAHAPVESSSNDLFDIIDEVNALRTVEGGTGYYMGLMPGEAIGDDSPGGIADTPGWVSASIDLSEFIAHEFGHNLSLDHAPGCDTEDIDPNFPTANGSIGAWGYDHGSSSLISPTADDLMNYCENQWISDYSFDKALEYRVSTTGADLRGRIAASPTRALLVWGGVRPGGGLYLNPAFVVDASPALPRSDGDYRLIGTASSGRQLFALRFDMRKLSDIEGASRFLFALPVEPGWEELASVTLSGPEGSITLGGEGGNAMAILRDPGNGEVRGFLRDIGPDLAASNAAGGLGTRGMEVLFSRGIPDADAWRR